MNFCFENMLGTLDIILKILNVLAILIGGFWAYFKFIKGRLFHPRLELNLEGQLLQNNNVSHLLLKYEVKNVGLSKVNINTDNSGMRVKKYYPRLDSMEIENVKWNHLGSFSIFEKHKWIESGEIIKESNLLSIKGSEKVFYQVVIRLVGQGQTWEIINIFPNNQN